MSAPALTPRGAAAVPIARGVRRLSHGEVHYRAAGEGPVVLALHASPRSSVSLIPVIEALADRWRVIAPDTPGYGLSTPLSQPDPTLDDFADALVALLDDLGVARASVYGTHTGAALALALARRAPQRVAALVLDGLSAFTPAEVEAFRTDYLTPYAPSWDGAHVMRLWSRVKDLYTWFPWCEQAPERRLAGEPPSPANLHASALGFLQSGAHYAKAYIRAAELAAGSDPGRTLCPGPDRGHGAARRPDRPSPRPPAARPRGAGGCVAWTDRPKPGARRWSRGCRRVPRPASRRRRRRPPRGRPSSR